MTVVKLTPESEKIKQIADSLLTEKEGDFAGRNLLKRIIGQFIPDPSNPISYAMPVAISKMEAINQVRNALPLVAGSHFKALQANLKRFGSEIGPDRPVGPIRKSVADMIKVVRKTPQKILDVVDRIDVPETFGDKAWRGEIQWRNPPLGTLKDLDAAIKLYQKNTMVFPYGAGGAIGHELPGHVSTLRLASKMGINPAKLNEFAPSIMEGAAEYVGSKIAKTKPIFGYGTNQQAVFETLDKQPGKNPYWNVYKLLKAVRKTSFYQPEIFNMPPIKK